MSIGALLIPLGMALASAVTSALTKIEEQGRTELTPIRVVDEQLVAAALQRLGATNIAVAPDAVSATTATGVIRFERVGQVMAGVLVGAPPEVSARAVADVEASAGLLAQARTAELAKAQAAELGFTLIEERNEQGTINYVFEEIA
ncbi:MAG: hypothetical protein LBE25_09870 [Arthrobacter sp.]|jgi:hypothetical protein|nr:hypothetical protein [Arthrobacter sp.]